MNSIRARGWLVRIGWRLLLAGLLVLPTPLMVAPDPVTAEVPRSDFAPIVGVFTAWLARNRTYRTANAYISSTDAYYDRLHAKAREQLETRELGGLRQSQVAAYVKVVVMIERERQAMTQFAESEKRAARSTFIDKVNNTIVDVMLSTTPATRVLGAMQEGIRSSKDAINGALDQLSGTGGGVLAGVQEVRQTASWVALTGEIVGGNVGARIRSLGNGVVETIDRPTEDIKDGLTQVSEDLGDLGALVEGLQARGYFPSAGEVGREALISVVTGDQADPAAEAIVDMLARKAGQTGGGFRGRARDALAGHVRARCAAVGARYREVLFRLQTPGADEETFASIEAPSCSVIDLGALAEEASAEDASSEAVADVTSQASPTVAPVVPDAPVAEATPTVEILPATSTAEPSPAAPPDDQVLDPCAVMPSGGTPGRADETTCFATFSAEPAGRTVQINLIYPHVQVDTMCQGMAQSDDYHTVMSTWPVGQCGYVYDRNYQGKKMGGYTGWSIIFALDRFTVLVSTKEEHPANQAWVESTAAEIEASIRAYRGLGGE